MTMGLAQNRRASLREDISPCLTCICPSAEHKHLPAHPLGTGELQRGIRDLLEGFSEVFSAAAQKCGVCGGEKRQSPTSVFSQAVTVSSGDLELVPSAAHL